MRLIPFSILIGQNLSKSI